MAPAHASPSSPNWLGNSVLPDWPTVTQQKGAWPLPCAFPQKRMLHDTQLTRWCRQTKNYVIVSSLRMRRDLMAAHRRHDISDRAWANIEKLLPGSKGSVGRPSVDNRLFINAVFWILRTGAPWRDLPPDLGDWKNTHRCFCRWRDRGVWEKILEALIVEPDFEWFIIDASHCKVHPHAAGAAGGNEAMSRTKGGSTQKYIWPWMRMVCRSELLLQKVPELIAKKPVR